MAASCASANRFNKKPGRASRQIQRGNHAGSVCAAARAFVLLWNFLGKIFAEEIESDHIYMEESYQKPAGGGRLKQTSTPTPTPIAVVCPHWLPAVLVVKVVEPICPLTPIDAPGSGPVTR